MKSSINDINDDTIYKEEDVSRDFLEEDLSLQIDERKANKNQSAYRKSSSDHQSLLEPASRLSKSQGISKIAVSISHQSQGTVIQSSFSLGRSIENSSDSYQKYTVMLSYDELAAIRERLLKFCTIC
jgi:hypothetical protein